MKASITARRCRRAGDDENDHYPGRRRRHLEAAHDSYQALPAQTDPVPVHPDWPLRVLGHLANAAKFLKRWRGKTMTSAILLSTVMW